MTRQTKTSKKDKTKAEITDPAALAAQLKEIQNLEIKIVDLKRKLLHSGATICGLSEKETLHFLLLRLGDKQLALPIEYAEEVLEMPAFDSIHRINTAIAGLVNYHGELISVIDIAEMMSTPYSHSLVDRNLVICHFERRTFGIMIDDAIEVIDVPKSSVTVADSVLPGALKTAGFLSLPGDKSTAILDMGWMAIGSQLGTMLQQSVATPIKEGSE